MVEQRHNLEILEPANNEGYGSWRLPCQRDREIESLMRRLSADRPSALDARHAAVLLAFAERMASLARREKSVNSLRAGIDAAAIGATTGDAREALLVLPLLWRSASTLGCDPAPEFRLAADRLGGSELLVEFAERDREDQMIEAMGYVEVDDESGFHYERTW